MRSMNSQFSELSQHPNLRRDGAVDGVNLHVTATHPPMSAQVFWKMGGGCVWVAVQIFQLHQVPDLRRDGAVDGVLVQDPASTHPLSTTSAGSWVEGADAVDELTVQ
jgi:hypothetical protein